MLSDILSILGTGISAVISWFGFLVNGEIWILIFSMISMYLVLRFLIIPFFGMSPSSDRSKRKKGD